MASRVLKDPPTQFRISRTKPRLLDPEGEGHRGGSGGAVRESHGHLLGQVVQVLNDMGVGYVKEAGSGRIYGASRRYLGEKVWRLLKEGARIRFSDSGRRTIKDVSVVQ